MSHVCTVVYYVHASTRFNAVQIMFNVQYVGCAHNLLLCTTCVQCSMGRCVFAQNDYIPDTCLETIDNYNFALRSAAFAWPVMPSIRLINAVTLATCSALALDGLCQLRHFKKESTLKPPV